MSALGERTLILHLLDRDSVETMVREGIPEEIIPTEDLRPIVAWVIDYYFASGRTRAPSLEALRSVEVNRQNFGAILDDHEVPIGDEPDDTVEWALDDLRSSWVYRKVNAFNSDLAKSMAEAEAPDRVDVVSAAAGELLQVALVVQRRDLHIDLREAAPEVVADYEARVAAGGAVTGLTVGLPEVDFHSGGLHAGELGILAAGPKVGKSFFLSWVALADWISGRSPCLFTLENSVEMMRDRIACFAAHVDPTAWWRGQCTDEQVDAVRAWANDIEKSDQPFWILRPDLGGRSLPAMVREAQVREASSVLIDQLTHCELPDPRKPKTERIGDALHILKGIISQGRDAIPCLVAHQINREGVRMARKVGYHEMEHLADSAEIERTADVVYGMYASPDEVDSYLLRFQTLAARRFPLKHWELTWQIAHGVIAVHSEITL